MSAITIALIITASLYVGYAYGQEVVDEVTVVLNRVRAVIKCVFDCINGRG